MRSPALRGYWMLLLLCGLLSGCRGLPNGNAPDSGSSPATQPLKSKPFLVVAHGGDPICVPIIACRTSAVRDLLSVYAVDPATSGLTKTAVFERDESSLGVFAITSGSGQVVTAYRSMLFSLNKDGHFTATRNIAAETSTSYPTIVSPDGRWLLLNDRRMFRLEGGALIPAPSADVPCFIPVANASGSHGLKSFFDRTGQYWFNLEEVTPECGGLYRFDTESGRFTAAGFVREELSKLAVMGFNDTGNLLFALRYTGDQFSREVVVYSFDASLGTIALQRSGQNIPAYSGAIAGDFFFAHTFEDGIAVFRIERGSLTLSDTGYRSNSPLEGPASRILADTPTQTVAFVSRYQDNLWVWRFDRVTGELTPAPGSPHRTGLGPWGIEFTHIP
jgi:hypothetical protein